MTADELLSLYPESLTGQAALDASVAAARLTLAPQPGDTFTEQEAHRVALYATMARLCTQGGEIKLAGYWASMAREAEPKRRAQRRAQTLKWQGSSRTEQERWLKTVQPAIPELL